MGRVPTEEMEKVGGVILVPVWSATFWGCFLPGCFLSGRSPHGEALQPFHFVGTPHFPFQIFAIDFNREKPPNISLGMFYHPPPDQEHTHILLLPSEGNRGNTGESEFIVMQREKNQPGKQKHLFALEASRVVSRPGALFSVPP